MSPILPISFLLTLLCAFGAVEGVLFQQLMFVGAAISATILVCSFEAWSAREIPVRATMRAGFAIIRSTESDARRLRPPTRGSVATIWQLPCNCFGHAIGSRKRLPIAEFRTKIR